MLAIASPPPVDPRIPLIVLCATSLYVIVSKYIKNKTYNLDN